MWQLYAFASLLAVSGESIIDKFAIVTDRRIDTLVATFVRIGLFFLFAVILGATGVLGGISFFFPPVLIALSLIGICNSLCYTYLLRHVEVTSVIAASYLAPFLFLAIDTLVLHTSLSGNEIFGVILMVLGGFGFAIDGETHRFKKEFSPVVWLMLFLSVFYVGLDSYVFKYLHGTYGTSAAGFTMSYAFIMTLGLLLLVMLSNKLHLLTTKPVHTYVPEVAVSKFLDAGASILFAQALTLAAVSQVSAMESLEPLVLFTMAVIAQKVFRMRVDEKLGRSRLHWKAASIGMLVIGGFLAS